MFANRKYPSESSNYPHFTMKKAFANNRISYTLGETIGSGRFGKVYAAINRQGQQFAIKIVQKRRFPRQFMKFEEEAQTLAMLKHRNIIQMVEFTCDHNQIWIVMPRAEFDLSRFLSIKKSFSEEEIRQIGLQIVQAMMYLFEMKIIHRDLKPQNILIDKEVIKLCDFGEALQIHPTNNNLQIAGTPLYMAPETVFESQYGDKADVWSLGIVLYELATGKTPYYSCEITKLREFIKNEPIFFPPNLSPKFKHLLSGMLSKDPSSRFDWMQVKNHPFFHKQKQFSFQKIFQKVSLEQKRNKGNASSLPKACKDIVRFIEEYNDHKARRHAKNVDEIFIKILQFLSEYKDYKNNNRECGIQIQHILIIISFIKQFLSEKQIFLANLAIGRNLMDLLLVCCYGEANEGLLYAQYSVIQSLFSQLANFQVCQTQTIQVMIRLIEMEMDRQCSDPVWEVMRELASTLSNHIYGNLQKLEPVLVYLHESSFLVNLANKFIPGINKIGKMVIDCLIAFMRPQLPSPVYLSERQIRLVSIIKQNIVGVLIKRDFFTYGWVGQSSFLKMMLQCLLRSQLARKLFVQMNWAKKIRQISSSTNYLVVFTFILEITQCQGRTDLTIEDINKMMVKEYRHIRSQEVLNLYILHFVVKKIGKNAFGNIENEIKVRISIIESLQRILFFSDEIKSNFCINTFGSLHEVWIKPDDIIITNALLLARNHDVLTVKERIILGHLLSNLVECQVNYRIFSLICQQLVKYQRQQYFCSMQKFRSLIRLTKEQGIENSELIRDIFIWKYLYIYVMRNYTYKSDERQFLINAIRGTNFWNQIFKEQKQLDVNAAIIFITSYKGLSSNIDLFYCDESIFMKCFQQCKDSEIKLIRLHIVEFMLKYLIQVDAKGYRAETKDMVQLCNQLLDFKESYYYKFSDILIERTLLLMAEVIKHRRGQLTTIQHQLLIPIIVNKIREVSGKTVFWVKNNIIQIVNNLCSYGEQRGGEIDHFIMNFIPEIFDNERSELYPNILQLIGNLVQFSDVHFQKLVKLGIIEQVESKLKRENRQIVKQLLLIIKGNVKRLFTTQESKIGQMWYVKTNRMNKLSCQVQS